MLLEKHKMEGRKEGMKDEQRKDEQTDIWVKLCLPGMSNLADIPSVDLGLDVFRKLCTQRVVVLQTLCFLPVQPLLGAKRTNTLRTGMTNSQNNTFPNPNNSFLAKNYKLLLFITLNSDCSIT